MITLCFNFNFNYIKACFLCTLGYIFSSNETVHQNTSYIFLLLLRRLCHIFESIWVHRSKSADSPGVVWLSHAYTVQFFWFVAPSARTSRQRHFVHAWRKRGTKVFGPRLCLASILVSLLWFRHQVSRLWAAASVASPLRTPSLVSSEAFLQAQIKTSALFQRNNGAARLSALQEGANVATKE